MATKNIGTPYNIAEFVGIMQRVIGTGILSTDGDDYDEMKLEVSGDEITLRISFYTSSWNENKKAAYDRLKKVRRVIGGKWEKDYGYYMEFTRVYFGGVIELATDRENACKRVVTSVEEIPEEIRPAKVIPAHTKENVEWICDD